MTHSFTWTCREVLNEEITNIPTPAHHHSPRQLLSGLDGSSSPTPGNWFRSLSCPLSSGYLMQLSHSPPQTPSPPEMWHSVVSKASFWKPEVKPLGLLHLTTIKSLRLWTHRRVDPYSYFGLLCPATRCMVNWSLDIYLFIYFGGPQRAFLIRSSIWPLTLLWHPFQ